MELKNLWNRKKENVWLFLELIVITIVAWAVLDPAIVNLYYHSLPLGYDTDRLIYAEQAVISGKLNHNDAWQATVENTPKLLNRFKTLEGVENAYCYMNTYMSPYNDNPSYQTVCHEQDSAEVSDIDFTTDTHFFETYGLKPLPGSPSAEELSRLSRASQQVVLSRSAAEAVFGTAEKAVGKRVRLPNLQEPVEVTVAGVVEDVRRSTFTTIRSSIFRPADFYNIPTYIILRLKSGVDATRFLEEHTHDLQRTAQTDFSRLRKLVPYNEYIHRENQATRKPQEVNMNITLALFFLLNLILAVVGTEWLQAKRRTEECGVRRTYGATRLRLLRSSLGEAALLATIAVVIGCIIYLNYAYSDLQYYNGYENFSTLYTTRYFTPMADLAWPDHFWPHFLIVSACVYLIILVTVLIGTAIPAWRITRTQITEALREE